MEYITVKLILIDRNLTICNLFSPPNKAVNLHILQPNSEDWMIVGDFNNHSPSWGYPSLDAKGGTLDSQQQFGPHQHPNQSPNLLFKSVEISQHTRYCHSYRQHLEDCQKRSHEQLGGTDHKPVILTLAKQVNTSAGKMPSRPPYPSTVSTRMPPTSTLQSINQRKRLFQEVDGMTTSHTGTIPWRRSTKN